MAKADGGLVLHRPLHRHHRRNLGAHQRRRQAGPGALGGIAGVQHDEVDAVAAQHPRRLGRGQRRRAPRGVLQEEHAQGTFVVIVAVPDVVDDIGGVLHEGGVQPLIGGVGTGDDLHLPRRGELCERVLQHALLALPIEGHLVVGRG